MEKNPLKYRGVRPATLVSVLEGNGVDVPYEIVDYVVIFENMTGITRQKTLGKVVKLSEEESSYFTPPTNT